MECDLADFIKKFKEMRSGGMNEFEAGYMVRKILKILSRIHKRNVIHKDLKS